VLLGWRASTIDVDIKRLPDQDSVLRAIPALKESLRLNIELASSRENSLLGACRVRAGGIAGNVPEDEQCALLDALKTQSVGRKCVRPNEFLFVVARGHVRSPRPGLGIARIAQLLPGNFAAATAECDAAGIALYCRDRQDFPGTEVLRRSAGRSGLSPANQLIR